MENQESQDVMLAKIEPSESNEMFRAKKRLTKEALAELIASITTYGVIQPIALRRHPVKEGCFILIAGERRYHASVFAGKESIPAKIWDVSEEVAFQMQMTENLHREDIHPLNEGKAYRIWLEGNAAMTTKELALKFGKSESYVVQRLKLNDLINEATKDFLADRMMLGHALLLCRLTVEDQKATLGYLKRNNRDYGTVNDLQAFIDRNITQDLSKAPFDRKDATLCPKAGACSLCPKRSGASVLFADVKGKDKCFDRACFQQKTQVHITSEVKRIVETEPGVMMLASRSERVAESIALILTEHEIKPLHQYDDFNTYKIDNSKKVKGLWISGDDAGKIDTVFIRAAAENKVIADSPEVIRQNIVQRIKRSRELDQEKVYEKILTSLKEHQTQKSSTKMILHKDEVTFLWYIVWDKAGCSLARELSKQLHISLEQPEKIGEAIARLKPEEKAFMLRRVMIEQYGGKFPRSAYGTIIRKIAEGYGDIAINTFEEEQKTIRDKREGRQKEKLKALAKEQRRGKPAAGKKLRGKKSKARKIAA